MTSPLAASIAAWGLPTTRSLPPESLPDDAWGALLGEATQHRVLGMLGAAVRAEALPVTPQQRSRLDGALESWLAHALRVERVLVRVGELLDGAGIEHRVLKGMALAHLDYPEPSMRVFGDVDVLVPSRDFTRAARTITAALDAPRALPEIRPGFDDRFGREILLRVGAVELDLHRTFVDGAHGLMIELDDLWTPGEPFDLAGAPFLALRAPARLLHACYAAAFGDWPPRLVAQRDVAQILLASAPDPDEVTRLARRWRARPVLALAVERAWSTLGIDTPPPLPADELGYRPNLPERVLLAAHQGPGRGYTQSAAALLVLPTWRDRIAYARALAFPQPAYLTARGHSRTTFARHAWGRVRGARR